ncbi:hypothetical protein IWX75_003137 [Arthrobacter sp. CAN_A6]
MVTTEEETQMKRRGNQYDWSIKNLMRLCI